MITSKINRLVEEFPSKVVNLPGGWKFNQYETLNKIELYHNSQFATGNIDSQGFYKFFYNINQFPVDVEAKGTDVDTKDYLFLPPDGESKSMVAPYLMKEEFSDWARDNHWGAKLNSIIYNRPKYGSVVLKKVKKTIKEVSLHNLVCDPTVDLLWKAPVVENHTWTAQDLEAMPYESEKIQQVIDLYQKDQEDQQIIGREFYGWIKMSDVDESYKGKKDRSAYCMVVAAGVEKTDKIANEVVNLGIVIYWKEIKAPTYENIGDFPYRENHRRKIQGRWLGIGKVEELFDPQIRMNELQNIKGKGLYNSALQIYQSRDPVVARNLLEDLVNGEIMRVDSDITPVNTAKVDLNAFQQEENRWDKNIQERSFTFESETGQSMPSGTPFRLGALLSAKSGGFFDLQREDIGLFLADIFYEVMIPLFKKDMRAKHTLMLPTDGKGMEEKLSDIVEWTLQLELQAGKIPDSLEMRRNAIKEKILKRKFLPIEVPEAYYDSVEPKVKLIITDEQMDYSKKLETLTNLYTAVAQDPTRPPEQKDALLRGIMSLAGVNPSDYGFSALPPQQMQPQPISGQPDMPGATTMTNQTMQ